MLYAKLKTLRCFFNTTFVEGMNSCNRKVELFFRSVECIKASQIAHYFP